MKAFRTLSARRGLQRNVLAVVRFKKERMLFLPLLFTLPLLMSLTLADCRNSAGSVLDEVVASETLTNAAGDGGANKKGKTFVGGWPVLPGGSSTLDS
ncbi:hypothetical protein EVAR_83790_1 [Eumeta japonica]|uniref:Uncharacterized protein n=1 Tax=Eumeta variegata TaxID=151549 RepID=A0A4C1WFC7_EUMVA|nr:hypothetical protein EVAR_83790_1 [Eumeta japonica]